MPSLESIRKDLHYVGLCSLKGHAISQDAMERLVSVGKTETRCERCGELLDVFIDPDDSGRYIYTAKY